MFVGVDVIGVDGVTGLFDAGLRREGEDGGAVPIRVEKSEEPACNDIRAHGYRVSPLTPLVAGARYELSGVAVQPGGCSSPSLGAFKAPFYAPASVTLPIDLPVPAPELLVRRCPGRPDYYYIDLARPALPAAPVEVRLGFADTLHYCQAHGWLGIHCAPGQRYPYPLRWWAGAPHTGVSLEGPRAEWEVVCDDAREVPCQEGTPIVATDAGALLADAGTQAAPAPVGSAPTDSQPTRQEGANTSTSSGATDARESFAEEDGHGCRLASRGDVSWTTAVVWMGLLVLCVCRRRQRDARTSGPSARHLARAKVHG